MFIYRVTHDFCAKHQITQYDRIIDYCSVAVLSCLSHAHKFEEDRDIKFISYITYWIKNGLTLYYNKDYVQSVSHGLSQRYIEVYKFIYDYEQLHFNKPTTEQIHDHFKDKYNYEQLDEVLNFKRDCIPLDTSYKDDVDNDMTNLIASYEEDVIVKYEKKEFEQVLKDAINSLESRKKDIIISRYGLYDHDEETFTQISKRYKVSKERICQLFTEAKDILKKYIEERGYYI